MQPCALRFRTQAASALTHRHSMLLPPTRRAVQDKLRSSGSSAACRCSVKRRCRRNAAGMWRRCWGQILWRLLRGCCKTSSLPRQRMLPSSSFFRPALTQRPICSALQKQMAASPVTPARSCTTPCCPERDSIGVIMPHASAPLMECHVGCRRIAPDGVAGAGSGPGRRYSGCTGRSDRPVGVPAELPPGSCLATKVSCTRMTSPRGCGDVCKICVWAARQRATQFLFPGEKGVHWACGAQARGAGGGVGVQRGCASWLPTVALIHAVPWLSALCPSSWAQAGGAAAARRSGDAG